MAPVAPNLMAGISGRRGSDRANFRDDGGDLLAHQMPEKNGIRDHRVGVASVGA